MQEGHAEAAGVLLQHGADECAQNAAGQAPIHLAAFKGRCHVVRLLLQQRRSGAVAAAVDRAGNTALHLAAKGWRSNRAEQLAETVRVLVAAGASCIALAGGQTPAQLADSRGFGEPFAAAVAAGQRDRQAAMVAASDSDDDIGSTQRNVPVDVLAAEFVAQSLSRSRHDGQPAAGACLWSAAVLRRLFF